MMMLNFTRLNTPQNCTKVDNLSMIWANGASDCGFIDQSDVWCSQYQTWHLHFPSMSFMLPNLGWVDPGAQVNFFFPIPPCCNTEPQPPRHFSWTSFNNQGISLRQQSTTRAFLSVSCQVPRCLSRTAVNNQGISLRQSLIQQSITRAYLLDSSQYQGMSLRQQLKTRACLSDSS